MARQSGAILITGTIGDLTFYCMDGVYYMRRKSSLTARRVKKDPAFARSRERSVQFGIAGKLVRQVYYQLPKEKREHGLFGKLTALAFKALCEGQTPDAVTLLLLQKTGLRLSKKQPPEKASLYSVQKNFISQEMESSIQPSPGLLSSSPPIIRKQLGLTG